MGTAGDGISGSLRRRALLFAREIPSCLDPKVWVSTMDAGGIGAGRIIYAVAGACQRIPQPDRQWGKPECTAGSQAPLFRLSPAGRKRRPEIPGHRLAELLWAIWGQASENGGSKVIKTAPKELRESIRKFFNRL